MSRVEARPDRRGLLRALLLSVAAAAIPVSGAFLFPGHLREYEALSWLLLLVPAFLWAYHRGWRGVATTLALGMAVLSLTYAAAQATGRSAPPLLLTVVAILGLVTLGIGVLVERLSRVQYEAASERLALIDQLTGLPNRRHAELHLEMEFAAAERGRALSVVMFDIDNMQQYNARHGRSAGDAMLIGFAALLRQQKRRMDLAARYGPEEFVAILAGCMEEGAVIFAARVQEHLRAGRSTAALPTVSAGVAVYRPDMMSPEELLAAAEQALALAKSDGRDRVRIHGRGIDEMREPDTGAVQRAASDSLALEGPRVELRPFEVMGRAAGGIGQGRSAYVLTDDTQVRASLLRLLAQEGFQVEEGGSIPDANAPLQHEFDLVFIDIARHGAAAAELVREIRFSAPTSRIIGIADRESGGVPADLLRIRVDAHYVHGADDATLRQQMRELLAERDALTNVQLRQRHMAAGARGGERDGGQGTAERLRTLVQNSTDVLFTADADGRLTFLNTAWTAVSGTSVEDSLGRPLFAFFHADDEAALRAGFDALLRHAAPASQAETGSVQQVRRDARLLSPEGAERWFEVRLQPVRPGSGARGVTGALTDVTERRRAEDALRQREAAFRSLLENADDIMVLLNADGTIRYISTAVAHMLGTPPDACLGANPLDRVHPDDAGDARAALGALFEEPGARRTASLRLRRADGSWCSVHASGRSLLLTAGVEGIVLDVRASDPAATGPAGTPARGAPAG